MPVKRVNVFDVLNALEKFGYRAQRSRTVVNKYSGFEFTVGSYLLFDEKSGKVEICYHYNREVPEKEARDDFTRAVCEFAVKNKLV